jgi:hypothetical protein
MGVYLVAAGDAARKLGSKVRFSMPSTLDPNLVPEYVQKVLNHRAAGYVTEPAHRYRTPSRRHSISCGASARNMAGLPRCWST